MRIKDYKLHFLENLSAIYDEQEIESFFFILLEHYKNLKRIDLALNIDLEFSEAEIQQWNETILLLKEEIPIQYIVGNTHFCGLTINVNSNVLIPRPETEELVDWIVNDHQNHSEEINILDIGTGSGCIAIALAKSLKNAQVDAVDISKNALKLAKTNAIQNKVIVNFTLQNILETENLTNKYDIIVSNPPYVRQSEKIAIKKNVIENEPHLALFVPDNDALVFYQKIANLAIKSLNENGKLYFEINQYLAEETIEVLKNVGFKNIELRQDIYGNNRMICASIF